MNDDEKMELQIDNKIMTHKIACGKEIESVITKTIHAEIGKKTLALIVVLAAQFILSLFAIFAK